MGRAVVPGLKKHTSMVKWTYFCSSEEPEDLRGPSSILEPGTPLSGWDSGARSEVLGREPLLSRTEAPLTLGAAIVASKFRSSLI